MRIPFKLEHLECMDMREHEKTILDSFPCLRYNLINADVATTLLFDGRVLGCYGIKKNALEIGECWLIPSVYIEKNPIAFIKNCFDLMESSTTTLKIKRMQTTSLNDKLHNRYFKLLGFQKEGILKQYILENDYAMWGKTWAQK